MKKKAISLMLVAGMMVGMLSGCGQSVTKNDTTTSQAEQKTETTAKEAEAPAGETGYPEKDIAGAIMWAAGGACDNTVRAITPYAQEVLGQTIVLTNRAGASGGISTQYVNEQPADGYNLLFGAENPQVAKVMGTSDLDYDDFVPINIFCSSAGVVLVNKDSKYEKLEDLVDDMLARPGQVQMGITGVGGLPYVLASMMNAVNGTEPNYVTYEGEGPATTDLMGGHVDYTIVTLAAATELVRSGDLRALAVMYDTPVAGMEDVPVVTDIYPDYKKYMPWGPFYGVFVKNGTPQDVIDKLTESFDEVMANPEVTTLLENLCSMPLGLSGDAAREYVDNYKKTTSWLLYDAGATDISPEEFGIERP